MKQNYFKKTNGLLKFFTFLLLSIVFTSNAQCPTGDVFLSTQAAVNAFAVNYPNCNTITGNLVIGITNTSPATDITDVSPLSNITQVNGTVFIENNGLLQNLDGLNITAITGRLYIGGVNITNSNSQLQNINGLSSLTSIGQFLQIRYNSLLTNLNGMSNLTSVGLDIEIEGNTVLNNISALQNTTFNPNDGYGLTIINNAALEVCNLPNFCAYLANPVGTHPRAISGNLANCLTEAAVLSSCNLSVSDINAYALSYYPNPVKDIFNLSYNEEIASISVMNMLGQTVLSQKVGSNTVRIDLNALPSGNYFVKVVAKKVMKTVKIIKL